MPEIQNKIMGYVIPDNYSLHEWVDDRKLVVKHLCKNPNAISFLKAIFDLPIEKYNALPENKKIDWKILSENQNAMYLIKKKVLLESNLTASEYDNLQFYEKISWCGLSKNPNAIHLLMKNQSKIDWRALSENYNAIPLLKENISKINIDSLLKNKKLDTTLLEKVLSHNIDKIKREEPFTFKKLWKHPIGIKILVEKYKEPILWDEVCENPSIFAINIVKKTFKEEQDIEEARLKRYSEDPYVKIPHSEYVEPCDYKLVSLNPKAIQFLTENPKIIYWPFLSLNPKANKLLTERATYESELEPNYFRTEPNKISWSDLSKNPSVIRLLDKNLIEESPTVIPSNLLRLHHGISLENLCQNINAVKLLKKCIDNIKDTKHWEFLSENPCIFKDN